MKNKHTVIVVGGGHAGIEASMSAARLGQKVLMFVLDPNAIGRMSCNPSIGGLAKGHLVKEIDALGGVMGEIADIACIQFKTLNKSKGRSVWGPRAQVDKKLYTETAFQYIKENQNISIVTEEVVDIIVKKNQVVGVITRNDNAYAAGAVIITTGTFLNGLIHIGNVSYPAGRIGEKPSKELTSALVEKGIVTGRLKTGTPPRIEKQSITFDYLEPSMGEKNPIPFSWNTKRPFQPLDTPSYVAYTNNDCHSIIENSITLSPLFTGKIKGIGPRYCPSIEDKIVRFSDRERHQLFLEPEWNNSNQIYVNGFSTSMPKNVQLNALRSVAGLEECRMIRPGYAVEYDFFPTRQIKASLESKNLPGLFFAGQVNGTSGYEEAAAQGLVAGINAAQLTLGKEPMIIKRHQGYIGVLIDDLITKSIDEPYRMFTSSAEYRLSLRTDTAPLRLTEIGHGVGLVSEKQYRKFLSFRESINSVKSVLNSSKISLNNNKNHSAVNLLKRPGISIDTFTGHLSKLRKYSKEALFTAETDIKYEGYVSRETERVKFLSKSENFKIPKGWVYSNIPGLSSESIEKLKLVRPETLGQASRIAGVRQSDVFILGIHLKKSL